MAALLVLRPGADWTARGGLFDWVLEFLIDRISDPTTAQHLREIVENNLGSLWLPDLPEQTQREIISQLRSGLVETASQELPESSHKDAAIRQLQELIDLTSDPEQI